MSVQRATYRDISVTQGGDAERRAPETESRGVVGFEGVILGVFTLELGLVVSRYWGVDSAIEASER